MGNNNRLVKNVYQTSKEQFLRTNNNNWCFQLYNLVIKYNLLDLWNNENKINEVPEGATNLRQGWYTYLYKRVHEVEEKEWQQAMINKPKLVTYITFKKKLELEKYLLSDTQKTARYLLTSIRTGSNKLRIETGRWKKPKEDRIDRKCRACFTGKVEDESHFILECEAYQSLRQSMYDNIRTITNNRINITTKPWEERLSILMNPDIERSKIYEIIKNFIKKAYKRRSQI